MTRAQARKILRSNRGSLTVIKNRVNVTLQSVIDVVDGHKQSARILAAAIQHAKEIEAAELSRETEPEPLLCA